MLPSFLGMKFGNKISAKHIEYERNKMSVKLAAQVLSSSVADGIDFLRNEGDTRFQNSEATVRFIRTVDCLFDLLNSRNENDEGYKAPLKMINKAQWCATLDKSIKYLYSLKDEDGKRLMSHRRNTFVKGLIVAAKSVKELATSLLTRPISPFSYVCTYKFSQDHIELLFSCIRSAGGFNDNPNVPQFKAALRKILVRNSIKGSKYGNCTNLEPACEEPLLQLKWKKKTKDVPEKQDENFDTDERIISFCDVLDQENSMTIYKENILAYTGGSVVKDMVKSLTCQVCIEALLEKAGMNIYYLNLINIKNNRKNKLVVPSQDVVKVVKKCESYFNAYVTGGGTGLITPAKNIKSVLVNKIQRDLFSSSSVFKDLLNHDLQNCVITEDLHSTKLTKQIIESFLKIRFNRYGQQYTLTNLKEKKHGVRQQAKKLIIFQGL